MKTNNNIEEYRKNITETNAIVNKTLRVIFVFSLVLIIVGGASIVLKTAIKLQSLIHIGLWLLFISVALFFKNKREYDVTEKELLSIPPIALKSKKINYKEIELAFQAYGFKYIQSLPLKDLKYGLLSDSGNLSHFTINGNKIRDINTRFPKNSKVIIYYHSFKNKEEKLY